MTLNDLSNDPRNDLGNDLRNDNPVPNVTSVHNSISSLEH